MKTITTNGIELILVSVPEEDKNNYVLTQTRSDEVSLINPPDGSFEIILKPCNVWKLKILGTVSKDTIDFDCSEFLHCAISYNHPAHDWCRGIPVEGSKEEIADSFRSLLQSNGVIFENPYGGKPKEISELLSKGRPQLIPIYQENLEVWEAAEKNVVKKVVVLKKIKQ